MSAVRADFPCAWKASGMDDIDELLDEVERDMVEKDRTRKSDRKTPTKKIVPIPKTTTSKELDDWDIDDILADVDDYSQNQKTLKSSASKTLDNGYGSSKSNSSKCFPLYLGGTEILRGCSDGCRKKACDKLRCTSCDFKVHSFRDNAWNQNADYLFFRNTTPDESKLQFRLMKSKGVVAYCCQCSWKSITDITAVSNCKDLKWVCGKH